ncbi:MAG: hypothetical protein AB9842_09690 [Bacteroidales bacterium]
MKPIHRSFLITGIFAFAMGLLETIVVVYLRELYYPQGFKFPLVEFSNFLFKVELLREAVTIIMLLMVGILAGKTMIRGFAFFLYAFAVWDISYYLGLKFLLNWPSSFFTWDILFLIPIAWVGPVIAPIICSIAMIILAYLIIRLDEKGIKPVISRFEWLLLILGSLIVFISFIWDYSVMLSGLSSPESIKNAIAQYVPVWFNWYLFSAGIIIILTGIGKMALRTGLYSKK